MRPLTCSVYWWKMVTYVFYLSRLKILTVSILDLSGISLCGGDPSLMKPMACAIICACALEGEFYAAVDAGTRELVGYALWMPTGHELFERYSTLKQARFWDWHIFTRSEAQRKLGFDDFLRRLSDAGKRFYKDTVLHYWVSNPTMLMSFCSI